MDWRTNWAEFVTVVVKLLDRGITKEELSKSFEGSQVSWEGILSINRASHVYSPSLAFRMPTDPIKLKSGRLLRTDYLSVDIPRHLIPEVKSIPVGARMAFTATIPDKLPIPIDYAVEFMPHQTDHEAHLRIFITAEDCRVWS